MPRRAVEEHQPLDTLLAVPAGHSRLAQHGTLGTSEFRVRARRYHRRVALDGGSSSLWYFAYGANMSADVMVRRRGLRPVSSEPARLGGYELVFTLRGIPFIEPAFASICARDDATVHGVLHHVSRADFRTLTNDESTDYEQIDIEVVGVVSGRVTAVAYRAADPIDGLVPSRRYMQLLVTGAREAGLPNDYLAALQAHPSTHIPGLSRLFRRIPDIYQWLRRRGIRHENTWPSACTPVSVRPAPCTVTMTPRSDSNASSSAP